MTDLMNELQQLKKEVQLLRDRQEILDVVNSYVRGLDRLDAQLIREAYHANAVDRHGPFLGGRDDFVRWAIDITKPFPGTQHCVTSHNCEIVGDSAYADTYCLFFTAFPDGKTIGAGVARYIDQLERQNGRWGIVKRCEITDFAFKLDRSDWLGAEWESIKSQRDRSDLSYMRPLEIPVPPATLVDQSSPDAAGAVLSNDRL